MSFFLKSTGENSLSILTMFITQSLDQERQASYKAGSGREEKLKANCIGQAGGCGPRESGIPQGNFSGSQRSRVLTEFGALAMRRLRDTGCSADFESSSETENSASA